MMECGFRNGEPIKSFKIIDSHCHFGLLNDFHAPEYQAHSIIKSMNDLGIDMSIISSTLAIGADFVQGNELTYNTINEYPERFLGYVAINPNYPQLIEEELNKYKSSEKMKAIKVHPTFHDYPLVGENYKPVFQYANSNKMTILSHTWGIEQISNIGKLAAQYPDVKFIAGHSGGTIQAINMAIEVARKHSNIFLDLTCSLQYEGLIELMCGEIGAHRVLFGTDMPFVDPKSSVGRVIYSDITDEEKKMILGLNAANLFGIDL